MGHLASMRAIIARYATGLTAGITVGWFAGVGERAMKSIVVACVCTARFTIAIAIGIRFSASGLVKRQS